MDYLRVLFTCTGCGRVFDATDRGYNLRYQYGKPAKCDECKDPRVKYKSQPVNEKRS